MLPIGWKRKGKLTCKSQKNLQKTKKDTGPLDNIPNLNCPRYARPEIFYHRGLGWEFGQGLAVICKGRWGLYVSIYFQVNLIYLTCSILQKRGNAL